MRRLKPLSYKGGDPSMVLMKIVNAGKNPSSVAEFLRRNFHLSEAAIGRMLSAEEPGNVEAHPEVQP